MVNKTWDEMSDEERERYINQDYIACKHKVVDPSIIDSAFDSSRFSLASCYSDLHIPSYNVQKLLATLAPRQREAVSLIYLDGMTQERAASRMGISRRALRTHIIKARKRLTVSSPLFTTKE